MLNYYLFYKLRHGEEWWMIHNALTTDPPVYEKKRGESASFKT